MNQMSIFDELYPKYKITKPIRLIELFAGYGSQALALKYLGVEFEHWKICEWAVKSIQAYKDMHFEDNRDYSKHWTNENILDFLVEKGVSMDYNQPATKSQIKKQNYRNIYNNICITHNLVNIQKVKAEDLGIIDTDKYTYLMTYSFPCQDLSLAGKRKGMSDKSTRSGMLWEVERILNECNELKTMPEVLLMENVPQVHGENNIDDFYKWQLKLEELGYKNYIQDLIATDYGIPQTRNRCFMVSILGEYSYTFLEKQPLKLKLKDLLEESVDETYYLSEKKVNFFYENEKKQQEKGNGFKFSVSNGNVIAKTITTRAGDRMDDNFIQEDSLKEKLCNNLIEKGLVKENDVIRHSYSNSRLNGEMKDIKQNNISPTLDTRCDCLGVVTKNNSIKIKNNTKKGYQEALEGDCIDFTQPNSTTRRGRVQKNKAQTLTTQNNLGVVTIGNYSPSNHNSSRIVDNKGCSPTVMENHGTVTATQTKDLRIRKLTPKECFRLMGVKDEDFEKIAKNQSASSLYHLAGDSIVVNVLMAIFKELL